MLASSQSQPQAPHLLGTAAAQPVASSSRGALKSLLERARARSPEPAQLAPSSARSRLRSLLTSDAPGGSRAPVPPRLVARQQRSPSPDTGRRALRFAPSALPALQRGDDGKWQPPSLSKGSMSTSALAELSSDSRPTSPDAAPALKRGHKHSLSVLFQSRRAPKGKAQDPSRPASPLSPASPLESPILPSFQVIHGLGPHVDPAPGRQQHQAAGEATAARRAYNASSTSHSQPPTPRSASASRSPPVSPTLATATHRRQGSAVSSSELAPEHYLVRLSTSYIVKTLTPIIRAPGYMASDKAADVRRLADDRLAALGRMERGWGGEWARAASGAHVDDATAESRVRGLHIGDGVKARERKLWAEALRDGVLLCFLLNHLFPTSPPRIPKVNVTEAGLLNSVNFARFAAALDVVGLPAGDRCSLADMDGTEAGIGRVAHAVISLARHAGPLQTQARATSPSAQRLTSVSGHTRTASSVSNPRTPLRPVSRQASSGAATPLASPTSSRPTSPSRGASRSTGSPVHRMTPLGRRATNSPSTNELHAKLESTTSAHAKFPSTASSSSARSAATPDSPTRPAAMARSITQPAPASPTRPTANRALSSSPTRGALPAAALAPAPLTGSPGRLTARTSPNRPVLRPRNAGSRTSVSFAGDAPGHARERTPSLVSSTSRVTSSAYTRSSAALSIATVLCDDNAAIDLTDDGDGEDGAGPAPPVFRVAERRMSEKTLHDARRRILGTLLKHEHEAAEPDDAEAGAAARQVALSASLAALEGGKDRADQSDRGERARLGPRRNTSDGRDVGRVEEEDESADALVRRPSAGRNKFYIPKRRSDSPASACDASSGSPLSSPTVGLFVAPRIPSKKERRRSDGVSLAGGGHGADGDRAAAGGVVPAARNRSMVNLPSGARPHNPREASRDSLSLAKGSSTSQILEIAEPGRPAVRYQVGNCIGRGQFGSVYRSLNLGTGQMVAIKRIRLAGMKEKEVRDVMREVELLQRLSHPSIVKYEGMSRDDEYLNIVLEFVENGSLGQTLKAFGNFPEKLVSSYVAKILEGLDYLHSEGVVHCDLKAANILSTKNGNIKLTDFGVSLNMRAVEDMAHEAGTKGREGGGGDIAGTPNWMAPEVIKLAGASPASDIWSLGCTIIELLTGRPPYADVGNSMSVLFRIVEDDMPPLPDGMSDELAQFLRLCFAKEPKARPTAAKLFEHEWVQAGNPEINLRPMDSVPFLRRVSQDLRRVDSQRIFAEAAGAPSPTLLPGADRRHSYAASAHSGAHSAHASTATLAPGAGSGVASSVYGLSGGVYGASASSAQHYPYAAHAHAPHGGSPAGMWRSQPPSTTDLLADDRRARWSVTSLHGRDGSGADARRHDMVKTTFAKAITCRVCLEPVRKVGVLCQACGLIAHAKCQARAGARCDVREQLALLALQQDAAAHSALSLALSPTLSQASERDAAADDDGGGPAGALTRMPARLFSGLRRSRTVLTHRAASASQLDLGARAASALGPPSPRPPRASVNTLDPPSSAGPRAGSAASAASSRPTPDSGRSHASALAYAEAAVADLVAAPAAAPLPVGPPAGLPRPQAAAASQTAGRAAPARPAPRPHARKDSKSDCAIM